MGQVARVRRFRKALRLFERLLTFNLKDTCGCYGVTPAQCHTLLELEELGQVTVSELAVRMHLDKSTLSRNVEGLVGIGLVRRSTHPGDRRAVALRLTAQGGKVCRRINAFNDRLFGKVLEALPPSEVDPILAAFDALARALATTMEPLEAACGAPPEADHLAPKNRPKNRPAPKRRPLRS